MFLHIGGDVVVPTKNVIAILDIETSTISRDTREFLKTAEEEGFVTAITTISWSFIIAEEDKKAGYTFLRSLQLLC